MGWRGSVSNIAHYTSKQKVLVDRLKKMAKEYGYEDVKFTMGKDGAVNYEYTEKRRVRRTPRLYKEVIEYEHERDGNGEVIADYPDGNDHWIDALRYATSPISMRRGQSA